MTTVKTRPIAFSEENIRAIQALLKTETRRVIIPQPWRADVLSTPDAWVWSPQKRAVGLAYAEMAEKGHHRKAWPGDVRNPAFLEGFSPYAPGDRLWAKETWRIASLMYDETPIIQYKAGGAEREGDPIDRTWDEDKYLDWYQRQHGYMATDCARAGIDADLDGVFRWTKETNPNRWHPSRFMPRWASRLTLEVESRRAEQLQHITARDCLAEGWPRHLELFPLINTETKALGWFSSTWDNINVKRGFAFDTNCWVWVYEFKVLES